MRKIISLLFLTTTFCFASNKIVVLISLARSASTPTLQMWRARGDFTLINEPGVAAWGLVRSNGDKKYIREFLPTTYQGVIDLVEDQAKSNQVFVKEMSFAANGYLTQDCSLFKNPQIYFVFLIRHPHACYISNYDRIGGTNRVLEEVLSYKIMYELYERVKAHARTAPVVVQAEQLCAEPVMIVQKLCAAVEIPFLPQSLMWEKLSSRLTNAPEWYDTQLCRFNIHWNQNAVTRTSFQPLTSYKCDAQGNPTFEEIDEKYRAEYVKNYQENLPYYRKLCAYAL